MPTARAIPSSLRRSAASITKMRKMRRMPAAIENEPNVVKNDMKAAPASSAASSASCFVLSASSPSCASVGCMRSMAWSLSVAPLFRAARVRDEDRLHQAGLVEQALRLPRAEGAARNRRLPRRRSGRSPSRIAVTKFRPARMRSDVACTRVELVGGSALR